MLKLNAGCAVVRLEGYINIDKYVQCDLNHDLTCPLPYGEKTVDEILASHIIEHFSFKELVVVLNDWHRVLKDDGILHIRVPDLKEIFRLLIENENGKWGWFIKVVYGGQWNQGEFHKNGFTEKTLIEVLEKHGFGVKEILKPRSINGDTEPEINIIFKKTIK